VHQNVIIVTIAWRAECIKYWPQNDTACYSDI